MKLGDSALAQSPLDRLRTVTLGLLAHKSGPNVVAGISLSAILQSIVGFTPYWWAVLATGVWLVWIVVYAIADEAQAFIEEQKRKRENPWILDTVEEPYGIE